jgi:hypothetical protein
MCEREVIRLPAGCKGGGVWAYRRGAPDFAGNIAASRKGQELRWQDFGELSRVAVLVGGTLVSRSPALWRGPACCQLIDLLSDKAAPRLRGSN